MGMRSSSSCVKCLNIEELSMKHSFRGGVVWFFIVQIISVRILTKFANKVIKKKKKI